MELATTCLDATGHRYSVTPTRRTVHAEFDYVQTVIGYTYATYEVKMVSGEWPSAEAAAQSIEGGNWGAHWLKQDGDVRILTIYRD